MKNVRSGNAAIHRRIGMHRQLDPQAFLDWAVDQARATLQAAPDRPQLIADEHLQILYLRPIVHSLEGCVGVMAAINGALSLHQSELAHLLKVRGAWDGTDSALQDALLIGYGGLWYLDDLRRLYADLELIAGKNIGKTMVRIGDGP